MSAEFVTQPLIHYPDYQDYPASGRTFHTTSRPALRAAACGGRPRAGSTTPARLTFHQRWDATRRFNGCVKHVVQGPHGDSGVACGERLMVGQCPSRLSSSPASTQKEEQLPGLGTLINLGAPVGMSWTTTFTRGTVPSFRTICTMLAGSKRVPPVGITCGVQVGSLPM
jgi:hypothetical protein